MSHSSTAEMTAATRKRRQPLIRHPASGQPLELHLNEGTGDASLDALFPMIAGTFGVQSDPNMTANRRK
jgi:hypothetical protein